MSRVWKPCEVSAIYVRYLFRLLAIFYPFFSPDGRKLSSFSKNVEKNWAPRASEFTATNTLLHAASTILEISSGKLKAETNELDISTSTNQHDLS